MAVRHAENDCSTSAWVCRGLFITFAICVLASASAEASSFSPISISLPRCIRAEQKLPYSLSVLQDRRPVPASEIRARDIRVEAIVDGRTIAAVLDDQRSSFEYQIAAGGGRRKIAVRVDLIEGGARVLGIPAEADVLPTVQLRPPPLINYGEVEAGCASQAHCRPVDLSLSVGLWT